MKRIPRVPLLLLFMASFAFFGTLSVYFGQDNCWDLRNYHYYNVYALLNGRIGFDYAPAQVQTYFNPTIDIPFYFLVKSVPPVWVGFIMGGIHGINFWLVSVLSFHVLNFTFPNMRTMKKFLFATLCAAVGVYECVFLLELGTTQNDSVTSLFVLASLLVFIRILASHRPANSLKTMLSVLLSALLMGLGIGLKLTAYPYGIGMLLAIVLLQVSLKKRLFFAASWLAGMGCGILVVAGHWMLRMWQMFGNPIFPLYNNIFKSPYVQTVCMIDQRFLPKNWWEKLFYPFYFAVPNSHVIEGVFSDVRLASVYVLLVLALLILLCKKCFPGVKDRVARSEESDSDVVFNRIGRLLIIFFIVSYIVWQVQFSIYRYTISLQLLAPIMIVILVSLISKSNGMRIITIAVLFFSIAFSMRTVEQLYLSRERLLWGSSFFEVTVPKFDNSQNAIVIINGDQPWGYLIPAFPPGVRFLRVGANFARPWQKSRFQSDMQELIKEHDGTIYFLSHVNSVIGESKDLKFYNLRLGSDSRLEIGSKHEEQGLGLWKVERIETY